MKYRLFAIAGRFEEQTSFTSFVNEVSIEIKCEPHGIFKTSGVWVNLKNPARKGQATLRSCQE